MKLGRRFFSLPRGLAKDARGTVLVQFTIYIIAIMGFMGLALDGGRYLILNNSLQNLADASALAAAAQMDGSQNSLTNATTAANNLATNTSPNAPTHPWYDVSGATIQSVQFYQTLADLDANNPTTDPKVAQYVKVTTGAWQTAPWFLSAVNVVTKGAVSNNSTTATAVAQGNNFANCILTQSFFCNPFEGSESNPGNANNFAANVSIGTMMHLVNGANAPGNWGLLDPPPPLSTNPHDQTPFWAGSLNQCIAGSQGDVRTGNVAKFAQSGMNVRFDSPIASGDESLSAPVVIDGFKSNGNNYNCNRVDPNQGGSGVPATPAGFAQTDTNPTAYDNACNNNPGSCPLPRDRTFTNLSTGNAAWSQVLMGNGPNLTDLQAYWTNHHSGNLPAGTTTRYQIYQQEVPVLQGGLGTAPFTAKSDAAEPHGPQCTKSTLGNLSRRVINVAVVDCTYWGIQGKKPLPVPTLVAQFFMTEPALSDGSIYGELIGTVTPNMSNGQSLVHKIVQLAR